MNEHAARSRGEVFGALALALGLIVAIFGGILGLIAWLTSGPREVARTFMERARRGDERGVHALVTEDLRTRVPATGILSHFATRAPALRRAEEWSIDGASGGWSMICVTIGLHGEREQTLYFVTVEEQGGWRVRDVTQELPKECQSD